MSRLVSSLMLLSLMVMVVKTADCPDGLVRKSYSCGGGCRRWGCAKEKREALDAPMAHKTKRGLKDCEARWSELNCVDRCKCLNLPKKRENACLVRTTLTGCDTISQLVG